MHTRSRGITISLTTILLIVSLGVSLAPDGRASAQPLPLAAQYQAAWQTHDGEWAYPLTTDSLLYDETSILRASDAQEWDFFGESISISGDTLVVGADDEDGGEGDLLTDAGAVYVYERHQGGTNNWGEVTILRASDAQEGDCFGTSVSISGDTLVVGAYWAEAAYVYERNLGGINNWGEATILRASDAQGWDFFGESVSISGDTVVIGASWENGGAGDPLEKAGAAYVYARHQGGINNWGEVTILRASDAQGWDFFGESVSISGNTLVVGAWGEDGGAGNPLDTAGAAYVYERHQEGINHWGEVAILRASDAQMYDQFGISVSVSGDTLVVGAWDEEGGAGDPHINAGAAYVYERNQGGANHWGEVSILRASDVQSWDHFGKSVSIRGDTLAVGAYWENGGAGNPLYDAGAVYVYERNQGGANNWGEVIILHASDAQKRDLFGSTVSISGGTLVVGAWGEDGGAGDPHSSAGAAYVFQKANQPPVLNPIGNQSVDEGVRLTFSATATDVDGDSLNYNLTGAPPGATINRSNGTFSWTPTEAQGPGVYQVTVMVNDGALTDSETVAITVSEVNQPPVLDLIGKQNVGEGVKLTFTATTTDDDLPTQPLIYNLAGAPSGAVINSSNGAFSWTPAEAQGPGVYSATVVVSDGALTDSETFTITVNEVNVAPTISNIYNQCPGKGVAVGPLRFMVNDTDIPTNTLTLDKASSNTTLVTTTNIVFGIDGTLFIPTLTITPTMGVTGTTRITITVSDGDLSAYDTFILAVGVNCPPEFSSVPVEAATVGVPYSYLISAIDADAGDVLTFSAPLSDTWLTLTRLTSRTATLDGTPPVAGAVPVVLQVSDGQDGDAQAFTITSACRVYLPLVFRD